MDFAVQTWALLLRLEPQSNGAKWHCVGERWKIHIRVVGGRVDGVVVVGIGLVVGF